MNIYFSLASGTMRLEASDLLPTEGMMGAITTVCHNTPCGKLSS